MPKSNGSRFDVLINEEENLSTHSEEPNHQNVDKVKKMMTGNSTKKDSMEEQNENTEGNNEQKRKSQLKNDSGDNKREPPPARKGNQKASPELAKKGARNDNQTSNRFTPSAEMGK
ncbi:unnamed protein product [Linum trigynum]|uniref:Uncharacterized protein n=1 Tax=Linum trigynum TaxID=586398 RepID=A0AAV2G9Y0_9ROSI